MTGQPELDWASGGAPGNTGYHCSGFVESSERGSPGRRWPVQRPRGKLLVSSRAKASMDGTKGARAGSASGTEETSESYLDLGGHVRRILFIKSRRIC